MQMQIRKNDITGETLYSGVHSSGLHVYIIPKNEYSSAYAVFGTKYGSVDSDFIVPGETEITSVPDGIAHYLEHKMFDQPDGSNVFDKFSKYGGSANAFTTFNMTAYLFTSTANFEENLETLLDYVQSPYYTDETVEKERGIIGQEIRMYDDSPGWKLFFNFINCLYCEHPVKKEIAGTEESISHITADYLYKCYNTFYNLSNMALVIAGNVDVDRTLAVIESGIKNNEPFREPIKRIHKPEPENIAKSYSEQRMAVATPMFMLGWKDNDTDKKGSDLLKKEIEVTILTGMLFSKGSGIYKKLYDMGLINSTFSVDYTLQSDYAFITIDGESREPDKVYKIITDELSRIKETGLSEEDFNREKKVVWGQYIRSHNDIEEYAGAFLQFSFMGIDYFGFYDVYKAVSLDDINHRFEKLFDIDHAALSVIKPID